jgi:hypothetical protein
MENWARKCFVLCTLKVKSTDSKHSSVKISISQMHSNIKHPTSAAVKQKKSKKFSFRKAAEVVAKKKLLKIYKTY